MRKAWLAVALLIVVACSKGRSDDDGDTVELTTFSSGRAVTLTRPFIGDDSARLCLAGPQRYCVSWKRLDDPNAQLGDTTFGYGPIKPPAGGFELLALTPSEATLTPRLPAAVSDRIEVRVGARSMAIWHLQFPDETAGTVGLCVSYRGATSSVGLTYAPNKGSAGSAVATTQPPGAQSCS